MGNKIINILFGSMGVIVLLLTSGKVVYSLLRKVDSSEVTKQSKNVIDTGFLIGKCENILIYIMIWNGQFTALALLFTAKSIVRQDDIKKDSLYFLAGSMINFTYSIFITMAFKEITKFVTYIEFVNK